jgi:hypothetical protein
MDFGARDIAVAQASHMLTHPGDLAMWCGWWWAGYDSLARDPAGYWTAIAEINGRMLESCLQTWGWNT